MINWARGPRLVHKQRARKLRKRGDYLWLVGRNHNDASMYRWVPGKTRQNDPHKDLPK